jgi:hypothetical protein
MNAHIVPVPFDPPDNDPFNFPVVFLDSFPDRVRDQKEGDIQ